MFSFYHTPYRLERRAIVLHLKYQSPKILLDKPLRSEVNGLAVGVGSNHREPHGYILNKWISVPLWGNLEEHKSEESDVSFAII
jgi:hypothetical protein